MRILLDECAPRPLKRELADYEIRTVVEMGWSGKKNGELLLLMSQEGFTILLTTDQNLRYQQNLQQAGVAVVVLVASSNCDTIISETEKKCITINSPLKY